MTDPPPARRERRGRKAVLEAPSKLAIWVPGGLYDRVIHYATDHHLTVAAAARCLLTAGLNSDSPKAK